jgi:hypothetical protein
MVQVQLVGAASTTCSRTARCRFVWDGVAGSCADAAALHGRAGTTTRRSAELRRVGGPPCARTAAGVSHQVGYVYDRPRCPARLQRFAVSCRTDSESVCHDGPAFHGVTIDGRTRRKLTRFHVKFSCSKRLLILLPSDDWVISELKKVGLGGTAGHAMRECHRLLSALRNFVSAVLAF